MKQRLWVVPFGLYPRTVTIYLKEKGIQDQFEIIPGEVTLDGAQPAPGRPPGSLPILEISPPTTEGEDSDNYIFQSSAILEYLEDIYGPQSGAASMHGTTPEERAHVRDCMSILNEATDTFAVYCHNASKLFEGTEEQSTVAAKKSIAHVHQLLNVVEKYANSKGPWLAGSGDRPTIADCVAMSTMQFAEALYGYDLTDGHPRLKEVYETFAKRRTTEMAAVPAFVKEMSNILSVR